MYTTVKPMFKKGFQALTILVLICVQFSFFGASSAAAQGQPGQTGQPVTPMQESLQKAIDARIAQGLPAPSAVSYEYTASTEKGGPARPGINGAQPSVVKVTSKTTVHFDNPAQAGFEKWPDMIVEGQVPEGGYGSIKPGNYNQLVYDQLAKKVPGIWDKYEFGYEPRTYTFVENITGAYDQQSVEMFQKIANGTLDSAAVKQILLGFTISGPDIDYSVSFDWEVAGVTVFDFWAGFAFGYGLGLRLPMEAGLTAPPSLPEGSTFTPTSYVNGLDWNATDFEAVGIAAEDGNEFVMRFTLKCGVFLDLFGASVIDVGVNVDENQSSSFQTPFGPGSTFSLPGINVPVWGKDFGVASVEIGFSATPKAGSDKMTANWQATGDFAASGQLTYTAPLTPVSFGPLATLDGPSQTDIKIDGFRYYFTQFLVELSAYITLDVFGIWDGSFGVDITDIDLSALTGDLYLGVHAGTEGVLTSTTYVTNVAPTAVIDRTGTVMIGGIPTFLADIGSPLTFTGYASDPGMDDLTLQWDWADGPPSPDISTFYPVPFSVTETQTHTFTSGCLYQVTFSATDDDGGYGQDQVPVLITATDGKIRYEGYWQHQYKGNGKIDFDTATLNCYLAVAAHMSSVFPEVQDASSIKAAYDVLFMKNHRGSVIDQFDRELLVVWLNLANGGIAYDDMVDTNKDGLGDTPLYDVVTKAEQVRLNAHSTRLQILKQTQLLHLIYQKVK